MTDDAKKVWKIMEDEFGWHNEPEDIFLDFFEDVIRATKQVLMTDK